MNPTLWMPLVVGIVTTMLGASFQLWLHHRLSKNGEIIQLRKDLDALLEAFVSHTGLTVKSNGKSYRTGESK